MKSLPHQLHHPIFPSCPVFRLSLANYTNYNAWEMNFFQDFLKVFIGDFEKIGVEQPPAGRRSAKPQFSQSHLGKSLFKTYKILTYNV